MRVTEGMSYQNLLRNLARVQEKLQTAQDQISSGNRVNKPSDDPSAASDIVRLSSEKLEAAQWERNLQFGQSRLNMADTVLDSVQTMIERARTLAQISVSSSPSVASLNASEVDSLRDQIVTEANTTHAGRFIFGGSVTTTPPYVKNPDGSVSYLGNSVAVTLQVSRSATLETQIPGSQVFTGAVDIFSALSDLVTAMQTGDKDGMNTGIQKLEQFSDAVAVNRSKVAGSINKAANIESELSTASLARASDLTKEQAADMARAISDLTSSQTALQATMAAGARIAQLSLLDYLK